MSKQNLKQFGVLNCPVVDMMKKDALVIPNFMNILDDSLSIKDNLDNVCKVFNLGSYKYELFGLNNEHLVLDTETTMNPITRIKLREAGYGLYWGNDFLDIFRDDYTLWHETVKEDEDSGF
jgi:hypothetical protein